MSMSVSATITILAGRRFRQMRARRTGGGFLIGGRPCGNADDTGTRDARRDRIADAGRLEAVAQLAGSVIALKRAAGSGSALVELMSKGSNLVVAPGAARGSRLSPR
jgi:hypothetical protein